MATGELPDGRGRATIAGAVAALAGLAAAELFGLVLPGRPSPVTAVADRVISAMPDGPREALIGAVGTLDKPLLVVGIVAVVVGGGALIGRWCARVPGRAPWLFAAGAALGWLVGLDGITEDVVALGLVVAVGATVASLAWMRLVPAPAWSDREPDAGPQVDRRTVLRAAGLIGVASVVGLGVVTVARRSGAAAVDAVRTALRIPAPTHPAPALPTGVTPDVPGLAPAVTANADFYQIDVSLTPPTVDVGSWTLTIDGRVDTPLTLTYDDLLAMPSIERYVTLTCVSNEVGGDLVSNARWQGVRLTDLLAKVGVHPDADLVLGRAVDGFSVGFPRAVLDDGRDAMVVYAMNGEPLPVRHGFPVRMVVPGLYGYVSATKWLEQIKLTTLDDDVPFWFARGWSTDGRIEASSRIDVPRDGDQVRAGTVAVGGRAWHQHTGVGSVEVSVDGGPWQPARLAAPMGVDTWRLWSFAWSASAGRHTLAVRMHDLDGTVQSALVRPVFPGASSGLHTISVDVL
ncbi:MAG: molybdopterin-dependent oxidoreductase [Frankiales bacterium]|nr:molybdopterin-dependent oxidoreductase [Frankiales bacterium]